mgnify:CR=1 FL=1
MAGPCNHETSCAQRGTFRKHLLERGRTIFFSLIVREAIAEMQKKQEQERKEFVKPVITPSGEDYLETIALLEKLLHDLNAAIVLNPVYGMTMEQPTVMMLLEPWSDDLNRRR